MYAGAIATVEKYKDHPVVLVWGVNSEVYPLNAARCGKSILRLLGAFATI